MLLDDMAGATRPTERFRFTPAQLQTYGIHELQALEEVLRLQGPVALATRKAVAEKIRQRIGWSVEAGGVPAPPAGDADPRPFLEAYYAALRANLETGLLFGRRRLRQAARGSVPPSP